MTTRLLPSPRRRSSAAVLLALAFGLLGHSPAAADLPPTTTTLTVTPAQSTCGDPVMLVAIVLPTNASGFVDFSDGATALGSSLLDGTGTARITISGLAIGSHTLTAAYRSDGFFASSLSDPVAHEVTQKPTVLVLEAPASSVCNQSVLLQATLTPAGASGIVAFYDGPTLLGSGPVSAGGTATQNVSGLGVGFHALSSRYSGDVCYQPSVSGPASLAVDPVATSTAFEAPSTSTCGSTILLRATVTPAGGTGQVEYLDGTTSLALVSMTPSGVVETGVPGLGPGMHSLHARYLGDACFQPSASGSAAHEVFPVPTTTGLAVSAPSSICGDLITFTATVSPPGATGLVAFVDGSGAIGTSSLPASGIVVFSIAGLPPGVHSVHAEYRSDFCHPGSVSSPVTHDVLALPSSTAIDVAPLQTLCGEGVTMRAQVTPPTSDGRVQFFDGALPASPQLNVASGESEFTTTTLVPGPHALSAHFLGGGCYGPSASASVAQQVLIRTTSVLLTSSANPVGVGFPVTLTAEVALPGATGSIEFFDGAVSLGVVALGAGAKAALTSSTLPVGAHTITAVYSGDACTQPATSAPLVLAVLDDSPPEVQVMYPNGGEIFQIGTLETLRWFAADNHSVASVDLLVSRNNGTTYELLSAGYPNLGFYDWVVVPPPTNSGPLPVFSALLKVIARDDVGLIGSDVSDGPFAIFNDIATATQLAYFEATPGDRGVEIRWRLAAPERYVAIVLERAPALEGPWSVVPARQRQEGAATVALDEWAPGGTLAYRLRAVVRAGGEQIFAPLTVERPTPSEFAISAVQPNPSHGTTRIDYAVPRETPVRVSILDPQGRELAVLADGVRPAGRYSATWDARGAAARARPGVYFVRIAAPGSNLVRRIVVLP